MNKKLVHIFHKLAPRVVLVILLAMMGTWAAVPQAIAAGDWYVNPGESIQAAIDAAYAAGGGTVHVAAGTYYELITLKNGVLVQGAGETVTTINGDTNSDGTGDGSVVTALNVDSTAGLEGFTITNGTGTLGDDDVVRGGGMYNENSSPTLTNCTFSENIVGQNENGLGPLGMGAGIFNSNSSPTLTNCAFSKNIVICGEDCGPGGGMYNDGSSPTLTDCTFSENGGGRISGGAGGGMYNTNSSSPQITNCTFSWNWNASGAGMRNVGSSPTLINCIFSGNEATDMGSGGGMSNADSSPTLTNCTFFANYAYHGGGMWNEDSSPTLTNCTFSRNCGSMEGGSMVNSGNSSPTLTNCILWRDQAPEISDGWKASPIVTCCDVMGGYPGTGNIDLDPLFLDADGPIGTPTEHDNLRLSPGSPCIDAGDNTAIPAGVTADLDGNPRIVDGDLDGTATADMGAYESGSCLTAIIDFEPDRLMMKAMAKYVTTYIELPAAYDVSQIDISSIRLNGAVPALAKPTAIGDYDLDGVPDLMVKFDGTAARGILAIGGQVEVTITGKVAGIDFQGTDTIIVKGLAR